MNVTIKQLKDNEWQTIPNETFRGISRRDLLLSFHNTDTVCKVESKLGECYWCGKPSHIKLVKKDDENRMAWLCETVADYADYMEQIECVIDVFGAGEEEEVAEVAPVKPMIQSELQL